MPPQRLEQQVETLERKVSDLEQLPARMAELGSQIAQLRGEMHVEFSALRGIDAEDVTLRQLRDEMRAIRGNGADLSLAKLQEQMQSGFDAIRGDGADLSLAKLHEQIASLRGEGVEDVTLGQLRDEMRAIRGNGADLSLAKLQQQMQNGFDAIRGNGADLSLAKLHEEIAAIRGEGGEGLTLVALRQEIREGDEETRRLMRVLHEDLVQRIALLDEGRASRGAGPRRNVRRRKKRD
jgi:hypothetical protein